MSRGELYRAVRGAFVFVYLYLASAVLLALLMVAAGPKGRELALLWVFFVLNLAIALWAKRALLRDLLEGRTETLCGRVVRRELGDSLPFMRVEYLVLETERATCKLVLFPQGGGLGVPDNRLTVHYLPRSGVIVRVERPEERSAPRHRSRAWYRDKPRREEGLAEAAQLHGCGLRESYWFWERLPALAALAVLVLYWAAKALCRW